MSLIFGKFPIQQLTPKRWMKLVNFAVAEMAEGYGWVLIFWTCSILNPQKYQLLISLGDTHWSFNLELNFKFSSLYHLKSYHIECHFLCDNPGNVPIPCTTRYNTFYRVYQSYREWVIQSRTFALFRVTRLYGVYRTILQSRVSYKE